MSRRTALQAVVLVVAAVMGARELHAAGPALTTISDTVYRADGTQAGGTVLIAWPAFQTAEGNAVAAGNQSVKIGAHGAFTTQLVPNVGASPAGTFYSVVYQLDEAVANRDIVDEVKFKDGLSEIVDGTVKCLNASVWAQKKVGGGA